MLVAGASLSLLAPIAAQASDLVNVEEINSYVRSTKKQSSRFDSKTFINEVSDDIAKLKGRVDGLEAQQNELEAAAFSETTTMDGKAVFTLGAVDYSLASETKSEAVKAFYMYTMNLNTSFTGDDNLYVRIKTGNHSKSDFSYDKTYGTYLSSTNANGDSLKVDKIWYSFPVGDNNTVWVGPRIENY